MNVKNRLAYIAAAAVLFLLTNGLNTQPTAGDVEPNSHHEAGKHPGFYNAYWSVDAAAAVVRSIRQTFGEQRFGHMRFDVNEPWLLEVAIVDLTDSERQYAYTIIDESSDRVRIINTIVGMENRRRIQHQILNIAYEELGQDVGVGFDEAEQVFVVSSRVSLSEAARSMAEALVPQKAVRFVVTPDSLTLATQPFHSNRFEYGPHDAGLGLTVWDNGGWNPGPCTSGYTMQTWADPPTTFFGVTAGHCAHSNGPVGGDVRGGPRVPSPNGNHTVQVGVVQKNALYNTTNWTDYTDSLMYDIEADEARPMIFGSCGPNNTSCTPNPGHRSVTGYFPYYMMPAGTRVCFQGVHSGNNNCGDIQLGYVMYTTVIANTGGRTADVWCIDHDGGLGDSGGPVYQVREDDSAMAAGIISGGLYDQICFSSIDDVAFEMSDLDTDVYVYCVDSDCDVAG